MNVMQQPTRPSDANFPFLIAGNFMADKIAPQAEEFKRGIPFSHIVIDDFLAPQHAAFLAENFPDTGHPVWLDWRKRSPNQWGKQGPGDSSKFELLEPAFRTALNEFNSAQFLSYLERLTGIEKLLPDPYFTGGGIHQIVKGGILDIHTDFNVYKRLGVYRRLNVLIYLNDGWKEEYGGCLELWDGAPKGGGRCVKSVPPLYNRAIVFKTDKKSFHGHPVEWNAPDAVTRRSVALYFYTVDQEDGAKYDEVTDFQGFVTKPLPLP